MAIPAHTDEASFAVVARRLVADRPELGLECGPPGRPLRPLTEIVEGAELERWLANTASLATGADPRTAAAYLISIFTWRLGEILGGIYLLGAAMPSLTAAQLGVHQDARGNGPGRDIAFRYCFGETGGGRPLDRAALGRSVVDIHLPLVSALQRRTGLSARALWRLVTDGLSGGLLSHGKLYGSIERARLEAEAVLSDEASPLYNRQWQFTEIGVVGAAPDWFRLRGGCCRLYRTDGGDYCTTCVLRPREEQLARLRAFVERRGEAAG